MPNKDTIRDGTDAIIKAGAMLLAKEITQWQYDLIRGLLNSTNSMKKIQEGWNEIIRMGDNEMTDEKWKQFQDSRWSAEAFNDPVIQRIEADRKRYEENYSKAMNDHEESKVDTDDFFTTTAATIGHRPDTFEMGMIKATEREETKRKNKKAKVWEHTPRWQGQLKSAMGTAKKVDTAMKKLNPKPSGEDARLQKAMDEQNKRITEQYEKDYGNWGKDYRKNKPPADPNPEDDPNGGNSISTYSLFNLLQR